MLLTWILVIANLIYGIPLWKLRYQFRSAVYNDTSWKINIQPWFVKETIALFSNRYFTSQKEKKIGLLYRWYLGGNIILLLMLYVTAKAGL